MATNTRIVIAATKDKGNVHAQNVLQVTADKVSELLMKNHEQFHTYFFASALHNHIVHHLLALYALGATPDEVQKGYDVNSTYQTPAIVRSAQVSQKLNDPEQFKNRMGQGEFYDDFMKFFSEELAANGVQDTVNKFIFRGDDLADDMLARLFGGFLHPIIHLGYALEFDQPVLVAEALASTAVHDSWPSVVFLPAEKLAHQRERQPGITLVSLLGRLREDPVVSTAVRSDDPPNKVTGGLLPRAGDRLAEYLSAFTVAPDELQRKTAEMINAAIYTAACAQRPGKMEMFDFFLMHSVNTSIFVPVINQQEWISAANKCRLLERKARLDLALYAACRTPKLYPERVFQYQAKTPGDWESIFRRATSYQDDGHTSKLIRALKNGEEVTRPYAGAPGFQIPPEAFLTIAHMVMDSVERMDEPDYKFPKALSYFRDMNEQVIRVTLRWIRWCGLDEAWDDVPALPGNAML
ncbi:hypothetical protein NA57DRAFT_39590 [Rhizodiscina lignyota]|uniref:HypA-like protein n=1 Tax=Rhizodiscina lignyota TaxID=1504668 RepID=A0A9P4M5F2_9PEZI|nr:hypothetical protein NA57DRAFT_39590 [Rhizodiscina lignyota]